MCPACGQRLIEAGPPPIPRLRTNYSNPVVSGLITAFLILAGLGLGAFGLCMGLFAASGDGVSALLFVVGGLLLAVVFIVLAVRVSRGGKR